jgi:branched-subunit amino acid transport protein
MMYQSLKSGPLTAFLLAALIALCYVCLIFPLLGLLRVPQTLGHVMSVWFPCILSALVYVSLTGRVSTPKLKLYSRTLAVAVLAPAAAWMVYFFVGFVFLGWQM